MAEVEGGLIDYAEAELRLRQGSFDRSIALGGFAGNTLAWRSCRPRTSCSCEVGAPCAAARNCGTTTSSLASELVTEPRTEADLRWLRFVAANEDERPNADQLADELLRLDYQTHDHALRVATANLYLGFERGPLREHIEAAHSRVALIDSASDPYASTSMLNAFAYALFAVGQYRDALAAADKEIAIAEEFELPFVIPYAEINRACALTALREFAEARRALRVVEKRVARRTPTRSSPRSTQSNPLRLKSREAISAARSTTLLRPTTLVRRRALKAHTMLFKPLC